MTAKLESRAARVQHPDGGTTRTDGVLRVGPEGVSFRDDAGGERVVAVADLLGASLCAPGTPGAEDADLAIEARDERLLFALPEGALQGPGAVVAAVRRWVAAQFDGTDEVRIGQPPPPERSGGPHVVLALVDLTWGEGPSARRLMVEVSTLRRPFAWKHKVQLRADVHQDIVRDIDAVACDPSDGARIERLGALLLQHVVTSRALEVLDELSPSLLTLRVDELLAHLPWGIVRSGARYPLVDLATTQQIVSIRPPRKPAPTEASGRQRVLIIANPTGDLPCAEEEARALERSLRALASTPPHVVALLGARATRSGVRDAFAEARWDLVHYAGHSVFDVSDAEGSAWRLAGGDLPTVEILQSMGSHPPALVYSSSCESSREDDRRRLGYDKQCFGLASAFLQGGVRGYIGSFWPIGDRDAALLARGFYKPLLAGKPLAQALRSARRALIKSGRGVGAWAGVMLFGDPSYKLPIDG